MSSLFQYNNVTYECSCGKWRILPDLYFCRHCFKIKCNDCSCKEIDMLFCPRCLEVSSVPEARLKKNRCFNCNDCPICANVLSVRTENEKCYLICQYCQWSSRETNEEDRENSKKWPVHENPINDQLNEVMGYMKKLEVIENAPKDIKSRKAGKTWSALHLKDKYGMQQMVEKRRKMLAPDCKPVETHQPTDPMSLEEALELRQKNKTKTLRTVEQSIMQILANPTDPLLPVRVALQGRTLLRCECERTLVKRDFGVATFKFKISTFARGYVPDVRLSRPAEIAPGKESHVFISVSNLSLSSLNMKISPINGDGYVKCSVEAIDVVLPSSKDSNAAVPAGIPAENNEVIVFRQHNRIGLRLEVIPSENETEKAVLGLKITYTQDGSFDSTAVTDKIQNKEQVDENRELQACLRVALN